MLSSDVLDLIRNPDSPDWVVRDAVLDEGGAVANVYVVGGQSGEYTGHEEWTVAAFLDEGQANSFRDRLNNWCREEGIHRDQKETPGFLYYDLEDPYEFKCPLDPNMQLQYTGVEYICWAIPVRAEG